MPSACRYAAVCDRMIVWGRQIKRCRADAVMRSSTHKLQRFVCLAREALLSKWSAMRGCACTSSNGGAALVAHHSTSLHARSSTSVWKGTSYRKQSHKIFMRGASEKDTRVVLARCLGQRSRSVSVAPAGSSSLGDREISNVMPRDTLRA